MTLRTVRILGPTGPTGLFENVRVVATAPTGPTGTYEHVIQSDEDTRTIPTLCDAGLTGTDGVLRTVVVAGYTGPSS